MSKDTPVKKPLGMGTVGERLKTLRNAAGLTRREIEANHGIKVPSLISWEKGHRTPKKDKAELLVSVFKNYGIFCTSEWILIGTGPNPLEEAAQNPGEAYFLKEIHRFQSFYKDSVIFQVEDQYMTPWINKGDYVGGVFIDLKEREKFIDQVCLVKTRDFGTQLRLVQKSTDEGSYNLLSFSKKGDILNIELEAIARIVFLRRKL